MELDEALVTLGDFGRYQTIIYILICSAGQITSVWHMLGISFLGAVPDHHCKVPEGRWLNESIPLEGDRDGAMEYSSCRQYVNFTNVGNDTSTCTDGWSYDDTYYGSTIVNEV